MLQVWKKCPDTAWKSLVEESAVEFQLHSQWQESVRSFLSQRIILFWGVVHNQHVERSTSELFEPIFCSGRVETSPCSTQYNNYWTKAFPPSKAQRKPKCSKKIFMASGLAYRGDEIVRNSVVIICFCHCYSLPAIVMSPSHRNVRSLFLYVGLVVFAVVVLHLTDHSLLGMLSWSSLLFCTRFPFI